MRRPHTARTDTVTPLARFAEQVNRLCARNADAASTRRQVLAALRELATVFRPTPAQRAPGPDGYRAPLLYQDSAGWSVALVVLRPGEATPPHDHERWGAAATVQGVECNRRLAGVCPDALELLEEQLLPVGHGYLFAKGEIHQAVGAWPDGMTLSLHFLVHGSKRELQRCAEAQQPGWSTDPAPVAPASADNHGGAED